MYKCISRTCEVYKSPGLVSATTTINGDLEVRMVIMSWEGLFATHL